MQIEKDGDTLALVPAGERGTSGLVVAGTKRTMIPFNTVHLPQRFAIKADEIQGIRAFGSRSELQAVQDVVNKRLAKARRQLDATHEFQRMGALNGQILDADGSTVLLDIYKTFGVTRKKMSMGLNSVDTELRVKCGEALDLQEDALGSITSSGSRGLCGKNFWNKLIVHKSVKETYLNSQQAAALRGELATITGYKTPSFQRQWLTRNAWEHVLTGAQRPVVGRVYARLKLAGVKPSATNAVAETWSLDLSRVS